MGIRNLIRRCVVTIIGTDDKDLRRQQISYNGSAVEADIWAPYGTSYNIPPNSMGLYAAIGGDTGSLVVLPDRSQDRVKNLAEGEVAYFNPLTQTRSIYRENGDLEIVTDGENGDMLVTVKKDLTVIIGGDATVTVAGDATVDVTGNVDIDVGGTVDLDATGLINVTSVGVVNVTGATINLN